MIIYDEIAELTPVQIAFLLNRMESKMMSNWMVIFNDGIVEKFESRGFYEFIEKLQILYKQKFHEIHAIIKLN